MKNLEGFIVAAKAACYIGDGASTQPCRSGSHDLGYSSGDWQYLDSYFGGTDFLGQEVVWFQNTPKWAMNYYGAILRPDIIDAETAGRVIKKSLSELYKKGRFLGGFQHMACGYQYCDTNTGDVSRFHGIETVTEQGTEVYRLDYHGGLVRE